METIDRNLLTFLLNSLWQVPLVAAVAWQRYHGTPPPSLQQTMDLQRRHLWYDDDSP